MPWIVSIGHYLRRNTHLLYFKDWKTFLLQKTRWQEQQSQHVPFPALYVIGWITVKYRILSRKKYFNTSLHFEIGGDVENIHLFCDLHDRADLKKILLDVADSTLRKIFSSKKETRSFLHRLTWPDGLEENTFRQRHIRSSRLGNSFPEKGNFYFLDFTDWDRVVLVFLHQSCVGLVGLYLYLYSMLAQYILSLIGVESVFVIIWWACIWICRICLHRIHCFSSV